MPTSPSDVGRNPASAWELIFGHRATAAKLTIETSPHFLARAIMQGDIIGARYEAQRIALARDALPTSAERGAVHYPKGEA